MKHFDIFIEIKPIRSISALYVWDESYYYTVVDGTITSNKISSDCSDMGKPLFEGPTNIITAIANALQDQHNRGDLLKTQGQSVRMLDEITWLRDTVKTLITK